MCMLYLLLFSSVALGILHLAAGGIRIVRKIIAHRHHARCAAAEIIDATQWDIRYRAGLQGRPVGTVRHASPMGRQLPQSQ